MSNQGLLQNPPKCEYPTEFLVARLQGKKSRLFQDWEKLLSRTDLQGFLLDTPFYPYLAEYGNGAMWRYLADEYQWVYVRMNPSLRKLFAPYFIFRQSENLLVSLRFLHKKGSLDVVRQQMDSSLLNNDLRAALTSGRDFTGVIEEVETQLCHAPPLGFLCIQPCQYLCHSELAAGTACDCMKRPIHIEDR